MARRVDRVLPRTGWPACLYFAVVVGLLALASRVPPRPALVVDAVAFLAAGGWCALNFWRCRHAHCMVTGAGWLALAAAAVAGAAVGRSVLFGYEQDVFTAILLVGLAFEAGWSLVTGRNAVITGAGARGRTG